jgi:hypothetical protein
MHPGRRPVRRCARNRGRIPVTRGRHILSCALYNNWWPMINLLSYCLAPIPLLAYWSSHSAPACPDPNPSTP